MRIDKLKLDIVFIIKGLCVGDTGLIILIIALVQVFRKELCGGSCTVTHIRFHGGIIVGSEHSSYQQYTHKP